MVRAWSPAQVHEVWAPLALRLPQVHAAGHEVRAQAPRARAREPLCVLLAHEAAGAHAPLAQEVEAQVPHAQEDEAEARALLAQAHEAEAQALLAQAPSRRQAHPRVKVPLEVLLARAPCWAAVPLAIHLAHEQRL
jgi:hypothetical protein